MIIYQHDYCVKIKTTSIAQRTEMRIWCKDHIGEAIKHWSYSYSDDTAYFYFSKESDATLFKLTWA